MSSAPVRNGVGETRQIRKAHRADHVANAFIWGAAGVTILVLVSIIGYILYHGFYADMVRNYPVLPVAESSFRLDTGDEVAIIVNRDVRVRDLSFDDLKGLYDGTTVDWTALSEQDLESVPFAAGSQAGEAVRRFLFDGEAGFGQDVATATGQEEVIDRVRKTPGGIGIVSAPLARAARGVRVVSLRRIVAVVNPAVLEIRDNRKFPGFTVQTLPVLLSGAARNWNRLRGIDLPLTVVAPAAGSETARVLAASGVALPAGAVNPASEDGQFALLAAHPGAVSFTTVREAARRQLNVVTAERRETGPNLSLHFLIEPPKEAGKVGGISSIIVNTVFMIILTLLFSTPIGIFAAIYLVEYAKQGRLLRILRLGTETLAGIPSIIFGLFGFILFVTTLHLGIGLLSGTLTITLMILPTIIRTAEEALKSVPRDYREGSLALGATKLQTIFRVVVPAAAPGILTGVILAIGRAVGETAALLFTMGFDYRQVKNLTSSARMLSVHLYQLIREGISFNRAFATATVLIFIVLIVNLATTRLIGKMNRMSGK